MTQLNQLGVDIKDELASLEAEPRLVKRATQMLTQWQHKPGFGFPQIFERDAELEGAYRFFSNPYLRFDKLVEAHAACSAKRARQHEGVVLCLHDTSTFVFGGHRAGLGRIHQHNRGFLGHVALAVSQSHRDPLPFGVVAARSWMRTETRRGDKGVGQHRLRTTDDCESHRWWSVAEQADEQLEGCSVIHVMDREGDIYDCTSSLVARSMRFIVRAQSNRLLQPGRSGERDDRLLFDALEGLPRRYEQTFTVAARKPSKLPDQARTYPARKGRVAQVCIAATSVTVKRTQNSSTHHPPSPELNVVHVFEPCPPQGQPPVEWVLLTGESIETDEHLARIVDSYRQRWLIEEFFKAIKTGCAFEKRQLESYQALSNVLAMTLPIAWSMLVLRTQSRTHTSRPAHGFIDPLRLQLLAAVAKRYPLPQQPTLHDVAYSIAGLGGHLKRNGPPGWQTLRRGFETLLAIERGWLIATETCDLS